MFNTETKRKFKELTTAYGVPEYILSIFFGITPIVLNSWVNHFSKIPKKQYLNINNLHYVLEHAYEALAVFKTDYYLPKNAVGVWLTTPLDTISEIKIYPYNILENTDWKTASKLLQQLIIREYSNMDYSLLLNKILPYWDETKPAYKFA